MTAFFDFVGVVVRASWPLASPVLNAPRGVIQFPARFALIFLSRVRRNFAEFLRRVVDGEESR